MIPPDGSDRGMERKERILTDNECPLSILMQHPSSKGDFFQIIIYKEL